MPNPGEAADLCRAGEADTQRLGDQWLDSMAEALLIIPSVVMPLANVPDRNVLINHGYPETARIRIVRVVSFALDPRLFQP
ncbi:MAG TPA: RES domain-containing protein [Steroidobacteraceae bacterium]|nr:RES domain-containing protein [Steroidobacteraceae bacterium]